MAKDYYLVLGISRGADLNKIKKAYRKIVKQHHPDVSGSGENSRRFREVREAYETLMDENRRREYDAEPTGKDTPVRISRAPEIIDKRALSDEIDRFTSYTDEFFEGFLPGFFSTRKRGRIDKDNGGYRSEVRELVCPCFYRFGS